MDFGAGILDMLGRDKKPSNPHRFYVGQTVFFYRGTFPLTYLGKSAVTRIISKTKTIVFETPPEELQPTDFISTEPPLQEKN